MRLENILKAVNPLQIIGETNLEVSGIHMDSRMVKNGFMFVAGKESKTQPARRPTGTHTSRQLSKRAP